MATFQSMTWSTFGSLTPQKGVPLSQKENMRLENLKPVDLDAFNFPTPTPRIQKSNA